MATDPSLDIDAATGGDIRAFAHVVQSVEQIMATAFGERVMREWFGSAVPRFLGENLNEQTVLRFFAAVTAALAQWEPRLRVVQILPEALGRDGRLRVAINVEYRPRALLGDFTPEGARRLFIAGGTASPWEVRDAG